MTPPAYYCWLSERRWLWFLRRRFQPRPDQNYPAGIALLMPFVVTGLALAACAALAVVMNRATNDAAPPPASLTFVYVIIGAVAFTAGVIHWGFTALAWNQRAARLRAAGETTPPPARPGPFTRWLLGPLYLFILGVITPVALLTAVENIRGAARWHAVRTELLARGERLDIREIVPRPVPDDQNFFAVPPFQHLLISTRPAQPGRSGLTYNTNAAAEFRLFQMPDPKVKRTEAEGPPISVAEWAAALQIALSNQSRPKWRDDQLPRFATPPAGADDAAVVLTATSIAEPGLAAICDASRRPRAVFPVPWEDGFNALLPHLAHLKGLHRVIDARVAAKLARGDASGAFAGTECALRLADAAREEPLLISQLVRLAQYALAERTIWRGIAAHAWSDAQLAAFQQQLAQPDFMAGMAYGFEGERAMALASWERWLGSRRTFMREFDQLGGNDTPDVSLMPAGWIRQNQAELAAYYQRVLDAARAFATNPPAGGYLASPLRRQDNGDAAAFAGVPPPGGPYGILVRMLVPATTKAFGKAIRAQAMSLAAATGCALERYRLKHGAYPDMLERLVPEFLAAVPRDPMDGQPLRYARTEDGLFRLWSIGENGHDDGGVKRPPGKKTGEADTLDWVWP